MIRGRGTGYTIKGNVDVDTPFGRMKLPISKEGGTTRLKKEDDDDDDDENTFHDSLTKFCISAQPIKENPFISNIPQEEKEENQNSVEFPD
ncbi:hypothetical protein ACMD2_22942 [Ananas comosus]|uniref:Uncharacterized protein n=1 Tax=Ananas comosus TaxID=4615 RepID=A0A199V496_ANACO|nr:hypothetical protein ACMD2_22942 [Ananas comosus]